MLAAGVALQNICKLKEYFNTILLKFKWLPTRKAFHFYTWNTRNAVKHSDYQVFNIFNKLIFSIFPTPVIPGPAVRASIIAEYKC
jgi:hypothetical protein